DRGEEERLFGSVTNLEQWDGATRAQVDEVRTIIKVVKRVTLSLQSFKVFTPVCKYNGCQTSNSTNVQPMFENSPSLSITPSTKAYVSSLIDFPSPKIKSPKKLLANESKLQCKLQNLRRVLKRKRAIIRESTVRRMLQSIAYVPGFLSEYSDQLVLKIKAMSEVEKKCVILFDEMAIMKCIEYNKNMDMIKSFEDKGPLGRSSKYAKHALVIMIRGLYKNWKCPLCYFLTCNDIGLLPTALVCDQGTQNRKLFSLLGGTETAPKLKSTTILFKDIVKTYDIDRRSATARAMCKITPSHLNPDPFKKMSCKLALQTFSNSVASALKKRVLNQDPLENMFSIIRQKNGYNRNSTARLFRTCFASICSFTLMITSEKCNCENDDDESLTVDFKISDIKTKKNINDQLTDKNEETPLFESLSDCSNSLSSSPVLINKLPVSAVFWRNAL
ncbi:Transposable element P transposase, partial [Aphis craccivora]